jgi:hypothetical protein
MLPLRKFAADSDQSIGVKKDSGHGLILRLNHFWEQGNPGVSGKNCRV